MKNNMKRLLVGSGIAAAGAAAVTSAVSYAITKNMVEIALDREVPKNIISDEKTKKQLKGYETDDALLSKLADAGEKLKTCTHETVEITSHDGEKLTGHWRPCENPERILLAMHGWRSSWDRDFGIIADFWYRNNCSVLYAEQRGQGDSGGDYMGFGMIERYDCRRWLDWINDNCDSDLPVYLGGVSMGAATVLMATGLELPSSVRGVVADCGYTSAHAIWKHVAENNLHLSYGIRGAVANALCKKKINMGTNDYSTVEALRENKIPVLFIHGADDHFVPVEMTYENYEACSAPKKLFVVPGADHGMSYLVDREGYENALREFWRENDRRTIDDA